MCPVRFHRALRSMYLQDPVHYETLPNISAQLILDQWEWDFDMRNWGTIAHFRRGDTVSIPYAHLLPKFKDTSRYRQIVSYFKHPLKKVMSVAQRAIMFMINTLTLTHFNLSKTQDFLHKMLAFSPQMSHLHGEDVQLLPFSLDIKEMFTGLPHKVIRDSVDWLIKHARTCTARNT